VTTNGCRISVVMPVRDGEAFVAEAIASALAQGEIVGEVLVVDDGSRDRTRQIVNSFDDPRMMLLENEGGQGVSLARNLGLRHAGGDWVLFLDADDRLRPGSLAALLDGAEGHVAVYGDYERIDAAGCRIGRRGLVRRGRAKPSGDILERLLAGNFIVNGGIMLVDRRIFAGLGGFDPALRYCEDWHAWCRLASQGPIAYRQVHVLDYRVHGTSTMMARPHRMEDYRPALEAVFADPAVRAAVPPAVLAGIKPRAAAHLETYLISQSARAHRYGDVAASLTRTLFNEPARFPRRLAVCGAAIAGI
jgi:glycosyltransferase involved in cell wall biosynthesis